MKTTRIFKAAMVAVAMVAMTSAFSSCSKDSNDTVKPLANNTVEQSSSTSSTDQNKGTSEVQTAGKSMFHVYYHFGEDFFKVYDVKFIYTGEDGKQITENVNESNAKLTTTRCKTKWRCNIYSISKNIMYTKFPVEVNFRIEVTPKVDAPAVTGEVGAEVYYRMSCLSTAGKSIDRKYITNTDYFSHEGIAAGQAQTFLDNVLKKNTKVLESFTLSVGKDGKITSNHPELEVE